MGYYSELQIRENESLNRNTPDKFICANHFDDGSIKYFIRKHYKLGYCSYCRDTRKVISLKPLVGFIVQKVQNFYENAVNILNYDSSKGGYLGDTYTTDEVIQEFIELEAKPFEIIEDIVSSIDNIPWVETDFYYQNKRDELENLWEVFVDNIKNQKRSPRQEDETTHRENIDILIEVGDLIKELNIIRKLAVGEQLFRCRQHSKDKSVKVFDDITSPKDSEAAYPNRFSPKGKGMFYCSFDQKTARLETESREQEDKNYISTGTFELLEDVYVIDFNKFPKLPGFFGIKNKSRYHLKTFLYYFIKEISKKIEKDGNEHSEYLPTQKVTEHMKNYFNLRRRNKISGLIYPSSQNNSMPSAVFFWNKEESRRKVRLTGEIQVEKCF